MRWRARLVAVGWSAVVASACVAAGQAPNQDQDRPADPAEINKPFENPDVKAYVARFEDDAREVYAKREAIAKAVGLRPGMAVADVGAGTGVFTRLFAAKVGPEGRVFAVDIAPAFLEHIAAESKRLGQGQVRTVRGSQDATGLEPESVDVAFLCDTYHHLEHPGRVLASIRRALRPGGRLVVVDFDRRPGVSSEFVLKHIRAGKDVFLREIAAAGFEPVEADDPPKLKENFFAMFRKKAAD
jgi:ubiquinone/menaquinone biosynthesis C-methylase UbiE